MKIALVIVTFDAPERLRKHFNLLLSQKRAPDKLFIVNTGKPLDPLPKAKFGVEIMQRGDIGPAGGFREGARAAYSQKFDYIIFADDDAYPAHENVISFLEEDVKAGHEIVGPYYTTGTRSGIANHYYIFSRRIMREAGFHFAPLFMTYEDTEFMRRCESVVKPFYDSRIIIEHHFKPPSSSKSVYLATRNALIYLSLTGKLTICIPASIHIMWFSFFCWLLQGKKAFLSAWKTGIKDFWDGKTGPLRMENERWEMPEAEEGRLKGAAFLEKSKMRNPVVSVLQTAGKKIILDSESLWGYPLLSMLASEIYIYRRDEKKRRFMCRNSILKSITLAFLLAPLSVLFAPFLALLSLAKMGDYQKMLRDSHDDDKEFCRKADVGGKK